jgi:hypothetical protein
VTTYILCGGDDRAHDNFGKNLAQEIAKTVKKPRILDVFFSGGADDDWQKRFAAWAEWYKRYFESFEQELATYEGFYEQAKNADVIFFHGGRTSALLKNLSDFTKVEAAIQGKVYIGSSAGVNYLAEHFLSHEGIATGSGILPINTVVHYESSNPSETRSVADADNLERLFPNVPTIRIREGEFYVMEK